MTMPLVSVICLCYNHARWIYESVTSVLQQTYPNLQIIIVDDASTDNSIDEISKLKAAYPSIEVILSHQNQGNCKAFNDALAKAKGDFIIDFATDDIMLPDRISKQVEYFNALDSSYGVIFSDAVYIDGHGKFIRYHYKHLLDRGLLNEIPEGDVFKDVLATYFIASPTMMVRREVFDTLGGYDEDLSYEDFDFWVRSSRVFKYGFLNERTTKIRRSGYSMSARQYRRGDNQLHSTLIVCKKAQQLIRTDSEKQALIQRVKFELRQSVFSQNVKEAASFYKLLKELQGVSTAEKMLFTLNKFGLPLGGLRKLYLRMRY